MFLELAEVLDCPKCRSSFGLVAFVTEATDHRVIDGWLGCPLCEVEYPIAGGLIDFSAISGPSVATEAESSDDVALRYDGFLDPTVSSQWTHSPSDMAIRLAALLGVMDRNGMVVLLGPGLSTSAAHLARLAERIEVLCWFDSGDLARSLLTLDELATGVDPMLGAVAGAWPVRTGSLNGIALLGPVAPHLVEVERCARYGARLVVINPTEDDVATLEVGGFTEIASDNAAWVGVRD